ncbi:MAG TPA: TonB-dependent receptor [Steroidobacteraceae bacterium]|nr:TonB-dependent receptor [Steroidobacteraceae bacterium]
MRSNTVGNPLVRRAVRAVLTGGTLATSIVVAHAQDSSSNAAPAANQATATQAQTTAQAPAAAPSTAPVTEVVVTGSRISSPNETAISPVIAIGQQDFQQTGVTRVEDLLNQLPQVFSAQNAYEANGSLGIATVNLLGLGDKRTLVLVDGDRLGPGTPLTAAASDINEIPVQLVQSVDILTQGASSVYGADAVAGVVNFHIMQNFQGVRLDGNIGGWENGNGGDYDGISDAITAAGFKQAPSTAWTGRNASLAFIAGFNTGDGNGNVTFYATYRNALPALQQNFAYSACTAGSGYLPPAGNGKFSCGGSETAYPANFINLDTGATVTTGPGYTAVPGPALFNYGALNYFQLPADEYTAGTFMHYQFNDHATVYDQLMVMDNRQVAQIAPSGDFGTSGPFNCANPFLTANTSLYAFFGCPNTAGYTSPSGIYAPPGTTDPDVLIARRDVEGGNRLQDTEYDDFHEVLGLKGNIDNGGTWTYDASFQYSTSLLNESIDNYFSTTKLDNALNVTGTLAAPVCTVGPPCVPYNIFTTGAVTPAMLAYLQAPGLLEGRVSQTDVLLTFNGDLGKYGIQLPSANSGLQLNLGAEYRDVKSYFLPDEELQTGDLSGTGGAEPPVSGGIVSREGFMEALLPLVNDKPFAQSANLDLGYRYSSYDLGFNTNTYKFGADWSPTHDVRLRGTFTRDVRAPNIVELYSPATVALDGTYSSDPCAGATPQYTMAQCARTGVTTAEYGHIVPNTAAQYNGLLGGNPNLKPETALTTDIGIEFTPTVLPNFRAQFDYYDVKIEGVINPIGGGVILYECGVADLAGACDAIHRGPGGTLWAETSGFIDDTLVNAGLLQEKGVDVDIAYNYHFDNWGGLQSEMVGTYMEHYYFSPAAGEPQFEYDCAGLYGTACSGDTGLGVPAPRWKHRWSNTWNTPWQAISVTLNWRYIGPTRLEELSSNPNLAAPTTATIANGGISNTDAYLPSISYFDLTAAVKLANKVTLRLGCNNILDKQPPLIGATDIPAPPFGSGNTFPGYYDIGRYLFAEVTADF